MDATPWPVQVVLVVVIAVYAYDRFNSPPTNRACTTAARYHVAAFVYFLLYVLSFNVLLYYPQLLDLFGYDVQAAFPEGDMSGAIGVALLLTVLLPRAPVLSQVDSRLRRFLQRRAAIPSEAARLSKVLSQSEFEVPQDSRAGLEKALTGAGFDARHVAFNGAESVASLWTRMEFLFAKLQDLECEPKFAAFSHLRATEYARLKERHTNLRAKAKTAFELLDRLEEAGGDENFVQVVHAYEQGFREDLDEMLKAMCDFISQAVLSCKLTRSGRWHQLSELGFKYDEKHDTSGLSVNHVMALAMVLVPVFLANFIFFTPQQEGVSRGLLMAVMIVTVYCVAVTCAIVPKDRWRFSRRRDDGFRPWAFYVCAGLAAVALGIPVSIVFKTLIGLAQSVAPSLGSALAGAWGDLAYKWPYFFLSFMTAAVTAFHLDNRQTGRLAGPALRALEGVSLAAILAVTAYVVFEMLTRLAANAEGTTVSVPPADRLMGVSAIVGAAIGLLIPAWYRRTSAVETAQEGAADAARRDDLDHAAPAAG